MSEDDEIELFQRVAEILVRRGFARGFISHEGNPISRIAFTPEGIILSKLLKQLFDVPNVNPADLTPEDVAPIVVLILMTNTAEN